MRDNKYYLWDMHNELLMHAKQNSDDGMRRAYEEKANEVEDNFIREFAESGKADNDFKSLYRGYRRLGGLE